MPGDSRDGARSLPVRGMRAGHAFEQQDWVAEEVPVALEFNGISQAVMLATPLDLEDFALGFSLSEGLLQGADQLYSVEEEVSELGITLHCEIAGEAFARLKERRRTMAGRTGCGLCGTESLAQVARDLPPLKAGGAFGRQAIARALGQFRDHQALQQATGAVHAAGWCSADGEVRCLREDVGRHNALDKLIGALARQGVDASQGFIAITSRASFELVQKAASAGVSLLAAVSAPTSFAVTTADRAGMTLVGFAREQDLVVYCHPERLALPAPAENPSHAN
ncbi:formate dehydrogenase accessory sulfurtransferase FdhD [Pelomonas sp. SE-A7]|uniref:formate dehydrogenase accessory sulfurtransferase FdhD n=1 Tax=Pelomonas sp. SE-A7 TaxID=3054953 RepID=UPI00259CF92A|nr:formate dehydrogenase accessory sulfurtransferase FdhD [Pelomonas sp. SE-A7]MDM4768016.1 formate dehydrogenase accessory sulfurtransferase FdhD [Pelomonas sp. SE-A7]